MTTSRAVARRAVLLAALLPMVLWAAASFGQPDAEDLPGLFPLEDLGILARDELSVEINLHGPMLKLIAAATRGSEPAFSELIANLHSIRVQVAESDDLDRKAVRGRIGGASRWLEDNGWQVVVRTRDADEEVYIYVRDLEGEIHGIAVLALEEGEAAVINIVGRIDLESVARLAAVLDIPQLGAAGDAGEPDDE